jgi:hypothetical protein
MSKDITNGSEEAGEPVPPKSRLLDDARVPKPVSEYESYPNSPASPSSAPLINTRKTNFLGTILLVVLGIFIVLGLYLIFTS